jgi:hypothetical protein
MIVTLYEDQKEDTSFLHWGKFNCPMAVFLDIRGNDYADEWDGDGDFGSLSRFGKWIVEYDTQGFVSAWKCDNEDEAKETFVKFQENLSAFLGDDEEEPGCDCEGPLHYTTCWWCVMNDDGREQSMGD